ncbi:hypothetical protein ACSNOK_07525 [Streptomyces sp. URMC 126]|uniref:hypothetical protein n=1 Tax=Streptomyces sp. URMC 126 TaxID=3423401 RepID=UPI003F1A732D
MRIASAVGVLSSALWLPSGRSTVEDAVIDGLLDDVRDAPPDVTEVPRTRGETPEFMAAEAVRRALTAAGRRPEELDALAYAWTIRPGGPYSPPFRLAKELSVGDCTTMGVVQACNGGAAAVETLVARMLADDRTGLAAAVSSDTFEEYGSRRWTEPAMMVGGDGAAAVVLCRGPGRLALRSLVTRAHTCADLMEPGQDLRHRLPDGTGLQDERRLKEAAHSVERFGTCLTEVVEGALAEAELDAADPGIAAVLLPRLAAPFTESFVRPALPAPLRGKARVPDPHTGHLGSGDALANLEFAQRHAVVAPGEYLLVVNGGQGVAASCMVLTPGDG